MVNCDKGWIAVVATELGWRALQGWRPYMTALVGCDMGWKVVRAVVV